MARASPFSTFLTRCDSVARYSSIPLGSLAVIHSAAIIVLPARVRQPPRIGFASLIRRRTLCSGTRDRPRRPNVVQQQRGHRRDSHLRARMATKRRVLIVCTGNACRSQMAEALWRQMAGDRWECFSAGAHPAGFVHPLAVRAVEAAGGDLSHARSKHLAEFRDEPFDLVVTVCDHAREACPSYPHAKQHLHWPFDDPYFATGSEADRWAAFCQVRDEIAATIRTYLEQQNPA